MSKGKWKHTKSKTKQLKESEYHLRMTSKEKETLYANAKEVGLLPSEYIIARCVYMNSEKAFVFENKLENIINELNAIGRNLNQSTKALNTIARNANNENDQLIYNTSLELKKIKTENDNACKQITATLDNLR